MAETGAGESSSPDAEVDRDFEPTAEHLVHEYDDEATMDEEENMSSESGDNDELDDLQKEGDMPLEALLAMYGYGAPGSTSGGDNHESAGSNSEEEILNNHDLTLDKEEVARDILKHDDGSEASTVDELMETVQPTSTLHLLNGFSKGVCQDDDDEEEDEDYLPTLDDEVWKKSIQIGDEFQADIPELTRETASCTTETIASTAEERLLWDPKMLAEGEVVTYLSDLKSDTTNGSNGAVESSEVHNSEKRVRDDEQALYTLLQSDFNVDEAVRRKKLQTTPPSDPLSLWSEEECQNFESGLRVYGKNFFAIHQNKVRTRSVGELVQFYYFWKKTERREAFCNRGRIEKKKPSIMPGITDYTDRFIERTDSDESGSASPTATDCACDDPNSIEQHLSHISAPSDSTTPSHLPTVIHSLSDTGPVNMHPTYSLNTSTNIVSPTSGDALLSMPSSLAVGVKRSHDHNSADEAVANNGAEGVQQPLSPTKRLCMDLPASEHTMSAVPLTEGTSSVEVANVM